MFLMLGRKNFKALRQIAVSSLFTSIYDALNSLKWIKAVSRQVLRQRKSLFYKELRLAGLKP